VPEQHQRRELVSLCHRGVRGVLAFRRVFGRACTSGLCSKLDLGLSKMAWARFAAAIAFCAVAVHATARYGQLPLEATTQALEYEAVGADADNSDLKLADLSVARFMVDASGEGNTVTEPVTGVLVSG